MERTDNNLFFYSDHSIEWKGKTETRKVAFAGVIEDNNLKIAFSECSTKDVFDKKLGRKIALGRAIKKPIVIIDLTQYSDKKKSDVFVEECRNLLNKY